MWRVQALLGRALTRCHGTGPLRLSNGHHVEDEVINSSTVLSTSRHVSDSSSQRKEDGKQNKKKRRTSQFCYAGLARYTALDAVGWGAAAILFMQLCRRIHSQFSSVAEQTPAPPHLTSLVHKCTYRTLVDILSRREMLASGVSVMCLKRALAYQDQTDISVSSSTSSSSEGGVNDYSSSENSSANEECDLDLQNTHTTPQQGETLSHRTRDNSLEFNTTGEVATSCKPQENQKSHSLDEAVENLRDVAQNSVPIILNIIGLESAKAGDYEAAFECFLASAQLDYSKAQFNVGVCYEKGRGTSEDLSKALQYYRFAAAAGHRQAQYRCAKLLLNSRGQESTSDTDTATALSLLHSAATAGLPEAQLYLGVLFSQDTDSDGVKSVQFFRMAAENGDSTGLLFLGQCYERGYGVPQCYRTAVGLYQQAAAKGNKQAKDTLRDLHSSEVLRSIRSEPCLSILDQLHLSVMFPQESQEAGVGPKPRPDWPTHPLPHSWSTGSLTGRPPFPTQTLNTNSKSGGWIIGVG
ncbi:death ligand signal enhancer isoform X2 [Hoplias malabaricus]|uniref:death ligand signal enhancer isoform X2 n=1 Tax=Hoplias malabaricus TaxID=27720 RepID=UPI003462411F